MENLGRCQPVNVFCFPVSLDQFLIPGHVRQNTKLDLGIIRIQKYKASFRHKYLSDQPSQLHADWNILKVWLCTADTAGRRNGLVKGRMDSAILSDHGSKTICICGFQLGELTVFQNIIYDWILRCQFLQNICGCRIAGFCLLPTWNGHFFKKDHAKLLGRIDIKFFPCLLPDQLFQFLNADSQLVAIIFQFFSLYLDPPFFHRI